MAKNKTIAILRKIIDHGPAAIPYLGNVYSSIEAEKANEELQNALDDIASSTNNLTKELEISVEQLNDLKQTIELFIDESNEIQKLTVVIPVGGDGGSLFPITQVMPKCLVTVGHKSMLQHILDSLVAYRELFSKIIILTGKYSEAIKENVRQGGYENFVECKKVKSDSVPHALTIISDELMSGPFLIHYNDILIEDVNWQHIHSRYFDTPRRQDQIGMLLCSKYYPLGIGVITEGDAEILKSFDEKPEHLVGGTLANLAVAIFEPAFLNYVDKNQKGVFESSIKDALTAKRTISLYKVNRWHHIQDLKALYDFQNGNNTKFLTNRSTKIPKKRRKKTPAC